MSLPGSVLRALVLPALIVATTGQLAAETQIGQFEGRVEWNGWELDYDTFALADGLSLNDVSYNGVKILSKANFPVMSVYYEGNCGPYADRLNGRQRPVTWADNALLVAREFTQAGKQWFELGIREFIGSYDIYQVWYISEDGELDGHAFSRGLQCNYDHVHYPMWRFDFDIDGADNDQIVRQLSSGEFATYTSEFETDATSASQHGWFVEDTVSGHRVRIDFDSGAWNVGGQVEPYESYSNNRVGGVVYNGSEEGWSGGASQEFPYVNGQSLVGQDIALWYRGYLPHTPDEGAELWHSTGVRISTNLAEDLDGDGLPNTIDPDDDGDGVNDDIDAFPLDSTESVDTDSDGIGNNADTDDDGDDVPDTEDLFPLDATESEDSDSDGTGNNADTDDDNDGVADTEDAFPFNDSESVDTDGDGIGNNADPDDDGDTFNDNVDAFPLDPLEWLDSDGDGIGDNSDTDSGTVCNLLENGSLDENLNGWSISGTPTIDADAHSGAGAMRINGGWVSVVTPISGNTDYTISGFGKSSTGSGWAGLGVDFLDQNGNEIAELVTSVRPTETYGSFTLSDVTPAATGFARFWVFAANTRTLWVDEIDIRPTGCTSGGDFNQPPSVTSPGDQVNVLGVAVDLSIEASDREGSALQYSATNLPAGLQINSATGRITGAATSLGQSSVDVNVNDGAAQTTIQFRWRIVEDPTDAEICNLLPNGNFEANTEGWNTSTTLELIDDATEGQQALQYSGGSVSVTVPAQGGTNYSFTGDYKSSSAANWSGFGIDYLNASGEEIGEEVKPLAVATTYTTTELTGTVPAGAESIQLWIYTPSTRNLTLDNLVLRDVSCGL